MDDLSAPQLRVIIDVLLVLETVALTLLAVAVRMWILASRRMIEYREASDSWRDIANRALFVAEVGRAKMRRATRAIRQIRK